MKVTEVIRITSPTKWTFEATESIFRQLGKSTLSMEFMMSQFGLDLGKIEIDIKADLDDNN